jgi:hypothetical protein
VVDGAEVGEELQVVYMAQLLLGFLQYILYSSEVLLKDWPFFSNRS